MPIKIISSILFCKGKKVKNMHPKAGLDMFGIAHYDNYPLESHDNIETEDGYLLQIFRIPQGKTNKSFKERTPILLMHGLFMTSEGWLYNESERCLPYNLADLGYDVWLGNSRGNSWGLKHKTLDSRKNRKEFWDFSWHEIGVYDLPAMIDYILKCTQTEKLTYIGHSQGTTIFFVMASEKPEYNKRIQLACMLSPVVFNYNMSVPIFKFTSIPFMARLLEITNWLLSVHVLIEKGSLMDKCIRSFTTGSSFTLRCYKESCMHFAGYDNDQFETELVSALITTIPTSAAVKQLFHYNQLIQNGKFRKYDHRSENLKRYGLDTPQDYNLSNTTAPVALFYGKNDRMSAITDVGKLKPKLSNIVVDHEIGYSNFNHLDFLLGKDVKEMLYNDVIKCIQQYS